MFLCLFYSLSLSLSLSLPLCVFMCVCSCVCSCVYVYICLDIKPISICMSLFSLSILYLSHTHTHTHSFSRFVHTYSGCYVYDMIRFRLVVCLFLLRFFLFIVCVCARNIVSNTNTLFPLSSLPFSFTSFALLLCARSKDFEDIPKLSGNQYLRLASTLHGLHAMAKNLSPTHKVKGIHKIKTKHFHLQCFQTHTGLCVVCMV